MLPINPFDYWALGLRSAQVLAEAQTVVAFRMMGMVGLWPVSPSENLRMFTEKFPAFLKAGGAASQAALKGRSPDKIARAALTPIGRKTRANSRRLARGKRR